MRVLFLFSIILLSYNSLAQTPPREYNGWSQAKEKKYILLGEPTHGDGAVFDEKLAIIKYLHEQGGFNMIAFESGLYDNYKAWQLYTQGREKISIFNNSIFAIWSEKNFFRELMQYVADRAAARDTIRMVGFDNQQTDLYEEYFFEDLRESFKSNKISFSDEVYEELQLTFDSNEDLSDYLASEKKTKQLLDRYKAVLNAFGKFNTQTEMDQVLRQTLLCKIAEVQSRLRKLKGEKEYVQNDRDSMMAENFLFLTRLYPGEKMIAWGANYHFANDLKGIKINDTAVAYANKLLAQQKALLKDTAISIDSAVAELKELHYARPMGNLLKQRLGDSLYSVGFTCRTGTFSGFMDEEYHISSPPVNSIEEKTFGTKKNKLLIGNNNFREETYCSALGYIPMLANWSCVFDGICFIDTSYPAQNTIYKDSIATATATDFNSVSFSGTVIDAATRQPVAFADIFCRATNRSVVTNADGKFNMVFPLASVDSYIIVAALGYQSDSFRMDKSITQSQVIRMRVDKSSTLLNGVTITAKRAVKKMSAKDIIKKARANVEENYYAKAYNQQFFYRFKNINGKDSMVYKDEAVINTYNSKGMAHTHNVTSTLFAEMKQFRNTTNNVYRDKWMGVGGFGFTLNRDLIMNKRNVLHRTFFYRTSLDTLLNYDGRSVYKINFFNKRPGAYTTGIGYPSPDSSYGTLYIDAENYAVLRYEHIIVRKPGSYKHTPGYTFYTTMKITETYKQVDGNYFLNYFNLTTRNKKVNDAQTGNIAVAYYVEDIMSSDIELKMPVVIEKPVLQIKEKGVLQEDPEFWNRNSQFMDESDFHF
ncbi:MAG TPA: erythromycin esterase family protein [Flavipsychrobacter sp.]|nr:erythromycin esterase family protein [Flavipsychrobacter sp.]